MNQDDNISDEEYSYMKDELSSLSDIDKPLFSMDDIDINQYEKDDLVKENMLDDSIFICNITQEDLDNAECVSD